MKKPGYTEKRILKQAHWVDLQIQDDVVDGVLVWVSPPNCPTVCLHRVYYLVLAAKNHAILWAFWYYQSMTWQIVLIIYFIIATASSLQRRVFAQKTKLPPAVASLLSQSLVIFPLGITWALFERHWFPNGVNIELIGLMALAALFQSLFNILSLRRQKRIDATQFSIIGNIYTPITIIGSAMILKEGLTMSQTIGMILLVVGAVTVSVKGFTKKTFNFTPYTWLAFASAIVLGFALIAERGAIRESSIGSYFVVGYGIQAVFQLLFAIPFLKRNGLDLAGEAAGIFWLGVLRFGQFGTFALASVLASNVSIISSITTFKIVLIFFASYFLLKERENLPRKFIGVGLSVIGLLLS